MGRTKTEEGIGHMKQVLPKWRSKAVAHGTVLAVYGGP